MAHEALRGDQVGSRLGTDENDEEFDDENYKRLDPRSALGVVAERVSCRVWLPVLPPRNVAHAGMYLGEIRLRLMAADVRWFWIGLASPLRRGLVVPFTKLAAS